MNVNDFYLTCDWIHLDFLSSVLCDFERHMFSSGFYSFRFWFAIWRVVMPLQEYRNNIDHIELFALVKARSFSHERQTATEYIPVFINYNTYNSDISLLELKFLVLFKF